MSHDCHHLAHDERCRIKALLSRGDSQHTIARELNRHPSTISREIARNSGQRGYRHRQAQDKAESRRREASAMPRKSTGSRM